MKFKRLICLFFFLLILSVNGEGWGFFAHRKINRFAVYGLPPQMMVWYKPHIEFLSLHAPDPDRLRYAVKEEGAHHFIDIDYYGTYPYESLPRKWSEAVEKYSRDTLIANGIVPYHALKVFYDLKRAFEEKSPYHILKYSTFLGHYIADASVPLHATSNYNGQKTNQKGIHALWESSIPELLADSAFLLWTGKAEYIDRPGDFIWEIVLESAQAADTVLRKEKELSESFPSSEIFSFVRRNGKVIRAPSYSYRRAYNKSLNGMVEKRMRRAIHAVSSLWYTAWVLAGQPDLKELNQKDFEEQYSKELQEIDRYWHDAGIPVREDHE